ncbi:hypothetical protein ACVWXM_008044 [Bradyrhizobium sp. GM7.3]
MTGLITAERLRQLLAYDPATGIFTWLVDRKGRGGMVPAGSVAGTIDANGYRVVTIDNRKYPAARLAWFYVTRQWPKFNVDRLDGDLTNDRFPNLRPSARYLGRDS